MYEYIVALHKKRQLLYLQYNYDPQNQIFNTADVIIPLLEVITSC
jgi:hypothetical protein